MRTVVVTGAAGALGAAAVEVLAKEGWRVAGIDIAEVSSPLIAIGIGGLDLTNEAALADVAERVLEEFGQLDGLVNIAGGFAWEAISDGAVATWDRLYAVNLKTALVACRAFLPLLRSSAGSIVNIGASAAQRASHGMGAYTASKSAVARLTEALAEELKHDCVRVNAVLPSIIDTPANRVAMPGADFHKWVEPHDLARVISFLLSSAAAPITGALIPVTGRC